MKPYHIKVVLHRLQFDRHWTYFCTYAFQTLSNVLKDGNLSFPTRSRCTWFKSWP